MFYSYGSNFVGLFALSSAFCCHFLSRSHYGVEESWFTNKWFWAGLVGNLPVLIAFIGHLLLSRK